MDLFVSKYINKIDKKGRVSLPSSFRNVLPKANRNEIILYKSIKTPSIEGCGVGRLKEIAKRINNLDFFSEDYDDFSTSIFSGRNVESSLFETGSIKTSNLGTASPNITSIPLLHSNPLLSLFIYAKLSSYSNL